MTQRPRPCDLSAIEALRTRVPDRTYVRFDGPSGIAEIIPDGGQARLRCTVVAASGYLPEAGSPLGEFTPSGVVVLIRRIRYCDHDGSPHFNADSQVVWTDVQGRPWQASSNSDPDHYTVVVSGTDLGSAAAAYNLPLSTSGSLDEFRSGGAFLDFRGPCPGFPKDSEGSL